MADTRRLLASLQTLLADNVVGSISPQDLRDFLASCVPSHGSMHETATAETTIDVQNVFVKVAATTEARHLTEWTMPEDNRLTYTGVADVHIHLACSVGVEAATNNQGVICRIVKTGDINNADTVASNIEQKVGTAGDIVSTAVHFDTVMSTDDYLEVWIANATSTANLTVRDLYVFVVSMLI